MTDTWKEKTNYYLEHTKDKLQEILNEQLVQIMGYDADLTWTFEDACFGLKYLANGNVACNIQLSNSAHVKEKCVLSWIDEQSFDLAKYMYQVDEFKTKEEYTLYKPVIIDGKEKVDSEGNILHNNIN